VAGNLEIENESFAKCNHVWLLVFYKVTAGGLIFVIEATNGKIYYIDSQKSQFVEYVHGYYYLTPSDLRADIKERW